MVRDREDGEGSGLQLTLVRKPHRPNYTRYEDARQ